MVTVVKHAVGVLLALAGLALTALGVWFATQLGSSGTAEFALRPEGAEPVVIRPDVLNRVEADVVVTATPAEGSRAWMALANPSDATAVLGDARHTEVTGVEVQDWVLTTRARGSGAASEGLGAADLWRQQDDGEEPVTLTVQQDEAPETLVVTTDGPPLESLTLSVTDKTWFVESVVAALIGLFVLVVGVLLAWPRRASRRSEDTDPGPVVPAAPARSGDEEPTAALPRDPEEAAR